MFVPENGEVYTAPLNEESVEACRKTNCGIKQATVHLNRTLPSLLDEGCEFDLLPLSGQSLFWNRRAFFGKNFGKKRRKERLPATINHYKSGRWESWTLSDLRKISEELALGIQQHLEIEKGDRAALYMSSDVPFVMADVGCLLAQLVTVPISPEQPLEITEYMLKETEASAVFVSSIRQAKQLAPLLSGLTSVRLVVLADSTVCESEGTATFQSQFKSVQWSFPERVELVTLHGLRTRAAWSAAKAKALRAVLSPQDLATIVYTMGEDGRPLGAMLTHENLSGSALAAFNTLPCLRKGSEEIALSFLPLHHIFARGFVYGSLSFGQSLYFSSPRRVMKHLQSLRPNVFFTVPRLLEKVYEGWQAATFAADSAQAHSSFKLVPSNLMQKALIWAWNLASCYKLDDAQSVGYRMQLWIARQTVLRPLRTLFGGRLQCFISGGAALPAEVMTLLSAAGLKLCQGYGLTEASSTLSFTRRHWSQSGTVGVPMPGVELALAADGEVMVKAPYVMKGYYRSPEATRAVLEESGWLHTGDYGRFSSEGLLTITGQKKGLFKLSIGEYVAPLAIEESLQQSSLVERALVVGPGRKFCGLLVFPDVNALVAYARRSGLEGSVDSLLKEEVIIAAYQDLVDSINASLPLWSTVKRFQLVDIAASLELDAKKKECVSVATADRTALYARFYQEIERLYQLPRSSLRGSRYKGVNKPLQAAAVSTTLDSQLVSETASETASETMHWISMLLPSILSLKKEKPNHV